MSIYTKIKDSVSKMLTFDSVTYISPNTGFQPDDGADTQLQTNYQNSLYISRALEILQDSVATIDFKLFQILSTKGEAKEIEVHEILDLLYKPNPYQTKTEFWKLTVISYKLSGEFFWRVIREEGKQQPIGLMVLNAKDIEIEVKQDGTLGYKYSKDNGEVVYLDQSQVIHGKNPNPNTPLRGFSILRTLLNRVEAEIKATNYQAGLFGRNGNPDGVLVVKNTSDADQLKLTKAAFYNSFRGKNESNRVAVVGGDASYTPLNSANNTLDFVASKNNVRDEVFMAFGIPKALITSDDVNRANADAALQYFMQFTIAPMFKMILEVINERFIIPVYGEQYYLDTEKLVTEDKDALLREAQAGINKWLTQNEVRHRFGYEPLEGGDVIKENAGFGSFFGGQEQQASFFRKILKSRKSLALKLSVQEKHVLFKRKQAYMKMSSSPEFKVKFSKAVDAVRTQAEVTIARETKKFFKEQRARIIAKLENVGESFTTANDIFSATEEKAEGFKYIIPNYTKVAVQAGNVALLPVKMLSSKANNFVMNSVLYKQLEARARLFSEQITDTTYEKLSLLIADNLEKGVPEVAKLIKELYVGMETTRALAIARTESGYMTSLGSEMAYQESDVVSGKEWLTTQDDKVRDEHVQVDGEIVGKNDVFSNGERFPADHSINCRCALAPVVSLENL